MGLWALFFPCLYNYQLPYFLMSMYYFVNQGKKFKKFIMYLRTSKRVDKINF